MQDVDWKKKKEKKKKEKKTPGAGLAGLTQRTRNDRLTLRRAETEVRFNNLAA